MNFKKLLIHLTVAAAIVMALVFGSKIFLDVATMHGKVQIVPDFTNMSVVEAKALAADSYMRIDVVDSLYVKRMTKGHIYRQTPKAGSEVKKGRRILVTINALSAKKVEMPDLIGFSMRQATAELQSRGLVLGDLIYKNDMATDNVLGQQRGGAPIAPGTQVESGIAIDLVVGLNSSDYTSLVPNLGGMTYMTAVDAIHSNSLNVGQVVCDTAIVSYSDSLRAVVYKQRPSSNYKISKGSPVSIYITLTPEKYQKAKAVKQSKSSKKSKK